MARSNDTQPKDKMKWVEEIFLQNKLEKIKIVKKIEIGFTNKVYSVNNKFILKVCDDSDNETNFEREVFFYSFFKDKIKVPKVIIYDKSKNIHNKHYMVYQMIKGDNLYSKWHLLSDIERENIIKQLCTILKKINQAQYEKFTTKFKLDKSINWHDHVISKINRHLKQVEKKKLISKEFIKTIKNYVKKNHEVLRSQKIALVYWDTHFDNILVKGDKIVGILDFERTELGSIDFVLDIITRMKDYPKKYMSEESEKFAKKKDYVKLLIWFKEFYPELFEFEDLDKRLILYSIEHDLDTLLGWPDANEVKKMIAKSVSWKLL